VAYVHNSAHVPRLLQYVTLGLAQQRRTHFLFPCTRINFLPVWPMNILSSASGNRSPGNMNGWSIMCQLYVQTPMLSGSKWKGGILRRRLKMGPLWCPETSVRNFHSMLLTIPKQRVSHLHRGGSPEVTQFCTCLVYCPVCLWILASVAPAQWGGGGFGGNRKSGWGYS